MTLNTLFQELEHLAVGDYTTPLACAKIAFDTKFTAQAEDLFHGHNGDTITDILLVGIGGSHLGVQAVYDALYKNSFKPAPVTLHTLTTLDTCTLPHFETWYTKKLSDTTSRIFTFIISKTGTTFETAAHASLCLDILRRIQPETYRDNLCIITDEHSSWHTACLKENISVLTIPPVIGGRYSVFSSAGLAPLRFLRVPVDQLRAGAQSVSLSAPLSSAQTLYAQFGGGYRIRDMFTFIPAYTSLGLWWRQLVGESLGKNKKGFLPTVSVGSDDLHSVVQYYFDGSQEIITHFLLPVLEGHHAVAHTFLSEAARIPVQVTFQQMQDAIIKGVLTAYEQAHKPFTTFYFHNNNAHDIGSFMQESMLETIFLGTLFNINPFDQPAVELYKRETRALVRSYAS